LLFFILKAQFPSPFLRRNDLILSHHMEKQEEKKGINLSEELAGDQRLT